MRPFTNVNARSVEQAVRLAQEAKTAGRSVMFVGGGSDLLGLLKERIVTPDVLVNLKGIESFDVVTPGGDGTTIGGGITLDALSRHSLIGKRYAVLAEAAGAVATLQIRNVATLAGNVCQRPWCWYYRNGFPCYKNGGRTCFTPSGENQLHAIFGGGPSFIVHPSDTAPALMALEATFQVAGPVGIRSLAPSDFFVLPRQNAARENVLADDEALVSVKMPPPPAGARSTYVKIMDRETWTHAVVSAAVVLGMEGDFCRHVRIVLGGVAPIPWRVPDAERLLVGQRLSEPLVKQAAEAAVADARPLSKNKYKVPMVRSLIERTILGLASRA